MSTATPLKRWYAQALKVEAELSKSAAQQRGVALETIAPKYGLNAQTLRRAVAVLGFVRDAPFKPIDLSKLPLDIVENLRRWHSLDAIGAKNALDDYITNKPSVLAFRKKFDAARATKNSKNIALSQSGKWKILFLQTIKSIHGKDRILEPNDRFSEIAVEIGQPHFALGDRTAYVPFFPSSAGISGLRRNNSAILEALGMSLLYYQVIIFVPTEQAKQVAYEILEKSLYWPKNLHVEVIKSKQQ